MDGRNIPIHSVADLAAVQYEPERNDTDGLIRCIADIPSISAMESRPISFALDGMIAYGAITLFAGDAGSGKTTVTTAIAAAISQGLPFAGIATAKCPVLTLDRENSLPVVQERFQRLQIRDGDNYRYWGDWIGGGPRDLTDPIYLDYVQQCEPKPLIIVDSLIAFLRGDENNSTEVRRFMEQPRRLASLGAAVVIIHHSGKGENTQQYRGSSDIKAAVDVAYTVKNSGESTLEKIQLTSFKSRYTTVPTLSVRYDNGCFSDASGVGAQLSLFQPELRELLAGNPGVLATQFEALARAKGIPRKNVREFLACDEVEKKPQGARGIAHSINTAA